MKKHYILIITLFILSLIYLLKPIIVLNGNGIVEIEVNTKYEDLGVEIKSIFNKKINVEIISNINTNKIGEYEIIYKITNKTLKRKIIVKDTKNPIIELNGPTIINVCSIDNYIEPGYKATDNYDGNITDKVDIKKYKNKILYSVMDSSNNKTIETRILKENDSVVPIINVEQATIIYKGTEYIDNTTVSDNCDTNIKLNIIGSVDTNTIGEYELKYEAIDSSNNKTEAKKIVKVIEQPITEKIIYLTFDDGPSYSVTPKLLDILKEENIKATFFVINHSDDLNYLIKREYDEGHTIALHSYSHNYKQIYSSVDAYFSDLEAICNKVQNIIGYKTNIIRFPGGSSNTISKFNPGIMSTLTKETINRGYTYFDWNVSSEDAGGAHSSMDVYNNVINNLNDKTNIILMHDFESNYKTLDAIKDIIIKAKELGYEFRKIDQDTPIIRHRINN